MSHKPSFDMWPVDINEELIDCIWEKLNRAVGPIAQTIGASKVDLRCAYLFCGTAYMFDGGVIRMAVEGGRTVMHPLVWSPQVFRADPSLIAVCFRAVAVMRGADALYVYVVPSLRAALRLLKRVGFAVVDVTKREYRGVVMDALVLRLEV